MIIKKEARKETILPAVMPKLIVTVRDTNGRENALVVGYYGCCSFDSPMIMVGIVPSRFSHHMIKENGAFVAHIVTKDQSALYQCFGKKSGRDGDKLAEIGLKLKNGKYVNAGIIEECSVAIECNVVDSVITGSHEMFMGKVECVHANGELVDEKGRINLNELDLVI